MKKLLLILCVILLSGCGSKKKIVTKKKKQQRTERVVVKPDRPAETDKENTPAPVINSTTQYIETFKDIAIAEMKAYGIPASITLAQGILESGSGKGRLAVKANNHFGIKCHGWDGGKIYHDDDRRQECFRKYDSASQSFRDHSEFLAKRKRYAKLFSLRKSDYKGWARELRRAGYATDRKYPEKLISLIERYDLYKYDDLDEVVAVVSTLPTEHVVRKGDTLYSISKRYDVPIDELRKLNGLSGNEIQIGQVLNLSEKDK